ncbi:HAD family hydrolase [Xanthovirga aplysinae]|uniref:HAD family hydrolase n=1 Tax=Xanthovirga aplysinae TaxID=2529853 RepID=UPI0012BC1564|nr:HAD family hydrolase [Xanthovirga aplysinae]MTI29970.1 HAD family hydrolase [Xanthovirga aplysinae]
MHQSLFVSDLDGTLLQNDGTLAPKTRDGLNQLFKNINFTIATARSYPSVRQILKGLELKLPVILLNGASITDFHTGEHLQLNTISPDLYSQILHTIRTFNCAPFISTTNDGKDRLYYKDILSEGMSWYLEELTSKQDKRLLKTVAYEDVFDQDIFGFTVMERQVIIDQIYQSIVTQFGDQISTHYYENQYHKGWYWLEIHGQKATKANAIKQLCDKYSFDVNELTVFGDNVNDIPMIKLAKNKIVVENAKPELKSFATKIIGSNEEGAVLDYLKVR